MKSEQQISYECTWIRSSGTNNHDTISTTMLIIWAIIWLTWYRSIWGEMQPEWKRASSLVQWYTSTNIAREFLPEASWTWMLFNLGSLAPHALTRRPHSRLTRKSPDCVSGLEGRLSLAKMWPSNEAPDFHSLDLGGRSKRAKNQFSCAGTSEINKRYCKWFLCRSHPMLGHCLKTL